MKVKNLAKLPKRKVTIDDLLDVSDISEAAAELDKNKYELDEFFLITCKGDDVSWRGNARKSRTIYLMELVKKAILEDGED